MNTNLITSESKFIERARVALTNAEANEIIKPLISEYGMNQNKIAEGWTIFHSTKGIWERNKQEDVETKIASNDYKQDFGVFQTLFKRHRTQTLIFFKKDPDVLISLGVKGKFPIKYRPKGQSLA